MFAMMRDNGVMGFFYCQEKFGKMVERQTKEMGNSVSWRITRPLRVVNVVKRMRNEKGLRRDEKTE